MKTEAQLAKFEKKRDIDADVSDLSEEVVKAQTAKFQKGKDINHDVSAAGRDGEVARLVVGSGGS